MGFEEKIKSQYVVVDTSAFIRNTNLQDFAENVITVPEVLNEIKSKRQLRRLVVLPYDLKIKEASSECIKHVAEFSKKTGDYPSLSATDLKVLALTYQLEKEHVGVEHLRSIPEINRAVDYCNRSTITAKDIVGFHQPKKDRSPRNSESCETNTELEGMLENCNISEDDPNEYLSACSDISDAEEFIESVSIDEQSALQIKSGNEKPEEPINSENKSIESHINTRTNDLENKDIITDDNKDELYSGEDSENESEVNDNYQGDTLVNEIFRKVEQCEDKTQEELYSGEDTDDDDDDDSDWITPSNIKQAKQEMDAGILDEKPATVACLTTDFAMQNVLKQIGLNVLSLDGRVIRQMRTFILRCYACYKTTSVMTRIFCHHCGNKTLKKVAVSVDAEGNQKIHINLRRPLTARGKKFSLPKPIGGKHSNYPILCEDQPVPDQRPTRLAKTKTNPLDPDYIAGFSPFVMRDINSKSAVLGIPNRAKEVKYWMQRNPNESSGKRRKKK